MWLGMGILVASTHQSLWDQIIGGQRHAVLSRLCVTMRPSAVTLDPEWESRYRGGLLQRYPWDHVVSFVFRHAPRYCPPSDVAILEIGCGSASNLGLLRAKAFNVAGIDGVRRPFPGPAGALPRTGLAGERWLVTSTRPLPFAAATFDLAIDRGAIVCVTTPPVGMRLREVGLRCGLSACL